MPKVEFRNNRRSDINLHKRWSWDVAGEMQPKTSTFVWFQLLFAAVFEFNLRNNLLPKEKQKKCRAVLPVAISLCGQQYEG